LLEARLTVGHGRVVVARDVTVEVAAGEICAVVGPNGAGKTTLLTTIAGLIPPIDGTVRVAGEPLAGGSARAASRAGVTLVPDNRALFGGLSALDNLRVADRSGGDGIDEVFELFPRLGEKRRVAAGDLSGGEQQMLALGRALVQRPQVLLIDEMSMGLAPLVVESLMTTIRGIASGTGAAVVLVEQHVHMALESADRALALVHGELVASGTAEQVRDTADLHSAYLGGGDAG
jgi:branched-chain amino acid transport system ATP-binding protein